LPKPDPVYVPYDEIDYRDRVPLEKYQSMKNMEDMALALQKENLKVIVVCAGIWYGNGENIFHNHFKVYLIINYYYRVHGFKIRCNCLI
jgi:adenylate kinase